MSTKYRLTSNVNDDKTALGYDFLTDFDAFLKKIFFEKITASLSLDR